MGRPALFVSLSPAVFEVSRNLDGEVGSIDGMAAITAAVPPSIEHLC